MYMYSTVSRCAFDIHPDHFNVNVHDCICACIYIYIQRLDEELAVATEAFFEGESCTLDLARREVPIQHYVLIIVIFHMKTMCIAH